MAKVRVIPKDALTEVLLKSQRRCCVCYDLGSEESVKGDIAQLAATRDAQEDSVDHLVYLCLDHHAKLDRGELTTSEVRSLRDRLYNSLSQIDHKQNGTRLAYQEYEQRVVDILRQDMFRNFGDFFAFEVESRLVSKSGLKRMADIAMILRPLGLPLQILVEIRYSSHELLVDDIEAVGAKFEDLGATKGIIVCNSGFSRDAVIRAKSMGIGLLHITEASEKRRSAASDKIVVVN